MKAGALRLRKPIPLARSIRWVPAGTFTPPGAVEDLALFLTQGALREVMRHLRSDPEQELLGFLLGELFECPETNARYVVDAPLAAFLDNGFAPFRYDGVVNSSVLPTLPTGQNYALLASEGSEVDPPGVSTLQPAGLASSGAVSASASATSSARPSFRALDAAGRQRHIQQWSARLLQVLDIGMTVRGTVQPGAKLIVANHASWLDISAVHALMPEARFVSKAAIRD